MAYCLDEAILWFGSYVENEVKKAGASRGKNDTEKKQKFRSESKFRQILGLGQEFSNTPVNGNG